MMVKKISPKTENGDKETNISVYKSTIVKTDKEDDKTIKRSSQRYHNHMLYY
jgi:hypothetical protein